MATPKKEKYKGFWEGNEIEFSRVWGGYRFSDAECEALLRGTIIKITTPKGLTTEGMLGETTFRGRTFFAFQNANMIPYEMYGHRLTSEERKLLSDGDSVTIIGAIVRGKKCDVKITPAKSRIKTEFLD